MYTEFYKVQRTLLIQEGENNLLREVIPTQSIFKLQTFYRFYLIFDNRLRHSKGFRVRRETQVLCTLFFLNFGKCNLFSLRSKLSTYERIFHILNFYLKHTFFMSKITFCDVVQKYIIQNLFFACANEIYKLQTSLKQFDAKLSKYARVYIRLIFPCSKRQHDKLQAFISRF